VHSHAVSSLTPLSQLPLTLHLRAWFTLRGNCPCGIQLTMRLINVHTRQFEEFIGRNIPQYAILSHTWEDEEVTYKHYVDGQWRDMKGYVKIDKTCCLAKINGIDYAWVDTCCIDKRSSAELTEAINSMFHWYQRAQVCANVAGMSFHLTQAYPDRLFLLLDVMII
jgi:hypothetical protein